MLIKDSMKSEKVRVRGAEWVFLSEDESLHPVDITHVTLDELHLLRSCYNVSFKAKQVILIPKYWPFKNLTKYV